LPAAGAASAGCRGSESPVTALIPSTSSASPITPPVNTRSPRRLTSGPAMLGGRRACPAPQGLGHGGGARADLFHLDHGRVAGHVSEVEHAGAHRLRVGGAHSQPVAHAVRLA